MIYYIYRINFLCGEQGRYYIGKHCANSWRAADKYAGSGVFCRDYYKHYGKEEGVTYTKEILNFADTKEDLSDMEFLYIEQHLSDPLCKNFAHGGGLGNKAGYIHRTEEQKKRAREAQLRPEVREKQNEIHLGSKRPPETGAKISASLKGKPSHYKGVVMSDEVKLKHSIANKGRKPAEITIQKAIEANTGRVQSKEEREKRRVSMLGKNTRPHTEEENVKTSEGLKRYWKRKRFDDNFMNKEIRTRDIQFSTEDNILSGKAVVFNEVSNILYDKGERRFFREVISPEAITETLISSSDVKLLVDHDMKQMLARSRNGKGSLKLELREDGLYFTCECPNTTTGRDIYEMIKREDYSQMSFAFSDGTDKGDITWDFSTDVPTRTVHRMSGLYDIAIVQNAAYDQTSVSARSIEEAEEASKAEPANEEVPSNEVSEEPQLEPQQIVDESYKEDLNKYKEIIDAL